MPQKVDHALLLMRLLAERQGTGAPLSLEDVARTAQLSQGYLEEVARLLRAAGLIAGKRGAGGGYVLTKSPSDITVADVMVAIEGRTWTTECLGSTPAASVKGDERPKRAANDAVWRKVQGQVMTTLRGITITDVAADVAKN